MKVLVVGGGGREHALAWKIAQSKNVEIVYVAPGNAGTEIEKKLINVPIETGDIKTLAKFATEKSIDLTVIGPEGPLVNGIVDFFQEQGLKCFGPTQQAAQLEGSKTFTKQFLQRNEIPTAEFESFTDLKLALDYLESIDFPTVIKADGLAAGKGVIIAQSLGKAQAAVTDMLEGNRFGNAGHRVVVEEFLQGEEVSFICMVDGSDILVMASSQDHKAAYDGDTGPNTGGMGAYSPAPLVDQDMHKKIMDQVMRPTVVALSAEEIPYIGFLYAGLMIGKDRIPKVLEYNCRFGDPETQPIMMRLQSDLAELCLAAIDGTLEAHSVKWNPLPSLGVVVAAEGYPGSYEKGHEIKGLPQDDDQETKVFHAGTQVVDGKITTTGGRVLCVTALGDTIAQAQAKVYEVTKSIYWQGSWYRGDIGHRAIKSSN